MPPLSPNQTMLVAQTVRVIRPACPYARMAAAVIKAAIDDYRGRDRGGMSDQERLAEIDCAAEFLYGDREHLCVFLDMMGADHDVWLGLLDDNRSLWVRQRDGLVE